MMKKLLCMLLILSGSQIALGYKHTIENATKHSVRVKISYYSGACSDDDFDLAPNHARTINAGICILRSVNADVYIKGGFDEEKTVHASPYKGPFTGSMNWQVT